MKQLAAGYFRVVERYGVIGVIGVVFAVALATGPAAFHQSTLKLFVYFVSVTTISVLSAPYLIRLSMKIRIPSVFLLFLGFLLFSLLPLIWNRQTYDTPIYIANYGVTAVFMFLVANLVISRHHLGLVIWTAPALTAALAVLSFLEMGGLVTFYGNRTAGRVIATMGNPNYLGGYLVMLIPLAACGIFGLFTYGSTRPRNLTRRNHKWRIILTAISVISVLCGVFSLLFTLSRGAWVGALIGWAVFIACSIFIALGGKRKHRRRTVRIIGLTITVLLIVTIIVIFVVPAVNNSAAWRLRSIASFFRLDFSTPLIGRIDAWNAAVDTWRSDPPLSLLFGRGLGSYYAHVFSYYPAEYMLYSAERSFKHAHNEFLELLADGGVVTLLTWLVLVIFAVYLSVNVLRSRTAPRLNRFISAALISGIIGILIHSMVSLVSRTTAVQMFFYFILALAWVNSRLAGGTADGDNRSRKSIVSRFLLQRKKALQHLRLSSPWAVAVVFIAIAVSLSSLIYGYTFYRSEVSLQNAMILGGAQAPKTSQRRTVEFLKESLQWNQKNIYSEFELLGLVRGIPPVALETIDNIVSLVPNYRNVIMTRGIVKASVGDYYGAAADLELYLTRHDITDKTANAHLLVSKLMMNDAEAALAELKLFLERQHRFFQSRRSSYLDLEVMDLRFSATDDANSKAFDNRTGRMTAVVSEEYLSRVVSALQKGRSRGYLDLLTSVYFTIGGIFSELEYADVELDFFELFLDAGMNDTDIVVYIHDRCEKFYNIAAEVKSKAAVEKRASAYDRARGKMKRYLTLMYRTQPDEAYLDEIDALNAETLPD